MIAFLASQLAYTSIDLVWLLGIILLIVGVWYLAHRDILVGVICIVVGLVLAGGGIGFR